MTKQIARGYISSTSPKRTKAEGQAAIEQILGLIREMLGGNAEYTATIPLVSNSFAAVDDYMIYPIDTAGGVASTDNLNSITFSPSTDIRDGMIIGLHIVNASRVVWVKNNNTSPKQIYTASGRDVLLNKTNRYIWLKYNLAADAFYQIFPDLSVLIDRMIGSRPISTLTVGSTTANTINPDRAIHRVTYASGAVNLNFADQTNYPEDEAALLLLTSNGTGTVTVKHNITGTGKFVHNDSADIVLATGKWVLYFKEGAQWTELARFGYNQLPLTGIAKGSLAVFDGTDWKNLGVGADGYTVQADSTQTLGIKWAAAAAAGVALLNGYRLSLHATDPCPTADQSGKSTIYLIPYKSDMISLYSGSGSTWNNRQTGIINIAVPASQYFRKYNVYVYDNAGSAALELDAWDSGGQTTKSISAATAAGPCVITATSHGLSVGDRIGIRKGTGTGTGWTDTANGLDGKKFYVSAVTTNTITLEGCDTTGLTFSTFTGATLYKIPASPTTAPVRQNGILCKTGALTRRFVGTFMTNGSGTVDDTNNSRMLSNVDNQVLTTQRIKDPNATVTAANTGTYVTRSGSLNVGDTRFEFVTALDQVVSLKNLDTSAAANTAAALGVNRCENAALGATTNLSALASLGYASAYYSVAEGEQDTLLTAGDYFVQRMAFGSGAAYLNDTANTYAGANSYAQASFMR